MPSVTDRYPVDPTDPTKAFADELRELKRRLGELEGRAPLSRTTMRDGQLIFKDDATGEVMHIVGKQDSGAWSADFLSDGAVVVRVDASGLDVFDPDDGLIRVRMGTFTDGITSFTGFVAYDGDGHSMFMTRNDTPGLVKPDIPAPFVPANQFTVVTSATFVTTAGFNPRRLYHDVLRVVVPVGSDPATTGELRLHELDGGATTDTLVTTAGSTQFAVFEWQHGRTPGDDPGSQTAHFVVEARRASGAGNINVYTPDETVMTSSALVTDADSAGNTHFV